MKILLAELLSYLFPSGDAHKANRGLMEKLVEQGHRCWVVASSLEPGRTGRAQLLTELAQRNIPVVSATAEVVVFYHQGVKVHTVTGDPQTYSRLLPKLMREFKPDWTLVSEDPTFLLLEAALAADPDRVVYVAHSQATLPFGPASLSADPDKQALLRRTAGIITVSHYVKEYIQQWAGLDSVVLPFPAVERFEEFLEQLAPIPRAEAESQAAPPSGETSEDLGGLLKEIGDLNPETQRAMLALLRKKVQGPRTVPLSLNQEQLWFLDQLQPGDPLYNMPSVTRLTGRLDSILLERSLNQLLERHEALRTSFRVDPARGEPVQVIAPALSVSLASEDLRELPEADREAEARRLISEEARRTLNLQQGPLLRATLLRLGEANHILILIVHHIISDGWSMNVLLRDLVALYQTLAFSQPSALPELSFQYADYCRQQREQLQAGVFEDHFAYWEQRLAGAATLDLPTDRPRPPVQTYQGKHQKFIFSQSLGQALIALSRRQSTTLFVTLLAAFKTLLSRYTGQADICVGAVIANRQQAELEPVVGFLANTVVLRTQLEGQQTFLELVEAVRETVLGAQEHSDLPFGKLVERLQPERDPSRSPLFQVLFSEAMSMSAFTSHQMTLRPVEVDAGTARFDLILMTRWDPAQGLLGTLGYNTDLFDDLTIRPILGIVANRIGQRAAGRFQSVA